MINWILQKVYLKDVKENTKNPRQISKEKIKRLNTLIDKFGLIDKPILNRDLTIIGGHQRIRILRKNKIKEVECWIPDRLLDQEEEDELCISLNLIQGSFDYDILANEWEPLKLLDYGFTEEQLTGIYDDSIEDFEKKNNKKKTKKECPNCGHQF